MLRSPEFSELSATKRSYWLFPLIGAALCALPIVAGVAQSPSPQLQAVASIEGTVRNSAGEPISGASVFLQRKTQAKAIETRTDANGNFNFSACTAGTYSLHINKSGFQDSVLNELELSAGERKRVVRILDQTVAAQEHSAKASSDASPGEMEFDDKPGFTVAGVSDWSNAGLHGSQTRELTSQALAKETATLAHGGSEGLSTGSSERKSIENENPDTEKELRANLSRDPSGFRANHELGELYFRAARFREAIPLLRAAYQVDPTEQTNASELAIAYKANGEFAEARMLVRGLRGSVNTAEGHRSLGNLDEELGEPLAAEREYEKAVRLDPSEQNYCEWGAELLLHKANVPAVEVFTAGLKAHPQSWRILVGLGAALYASGSYDEAAQRLCEASDLSPRDPGPYLFLGKIEKATVAPLPCAEHTLARFAREQPVNPLSNYYYAIAVWKRGRGTGSIETQQKSETLIERAVALKPTFGDAYLQLGAIYSESGKLSLAIQAYRKAIQASPNLAEAHRQLALAYKRTGQASEAQAEFQAYVQAEKAEAAKMDEERRQLRQFLIVPTDLPAKSPPH